MNMHSLPSALPGLGVPLGAGAPTPRGCWAWTNGLGLVLEHSSALLSYNQLHWGSLELTLVCRGPSKLGFCPSSHTLQSLPSQISVEGEGGVEWGSITSLVTEMGTVVVTLFLMVSAA